MTILGIIIGIVLIVFALWLVQTYLNAPYKMPVIWIILLLALLWIASYFVNLHGVVAAR